MEYRWEWKKVERLAVWKVVWKVEMWVVGLDDQKVKQMVVQWEVHLVDYWVKMMGNWKVDYLVGQKVVK